MSKDYGIWCENCRAGYLTDEHHDNNLVMLVAAKQQVYAAVRAVSKLNEPPCITVSLVCNDLWTDDREAVLEFIAKHHAHTLKVLDEYQFHDLGWTGNAR